jgi:sugar/nucleoside kinase (ribokinase family)
MKRLEVFGVENALIDILIKVSYEELKKTELSKSNMHLVDATKQSKLLDMFESKAWSTELGGAALNTIRTLSMLGVSTGFAGAIGKDKYGGIIKNRMEEIGVEHYLAEEDAASGTCAVLITPDGERTMVTCLGANSLYREEYLPLDVIGRAKILHFSGYFWDTPGQQTAINAAITEAKKNGVLVSFDLADTIVLNSYRNEFLYTVHEFADIVFANEEEIKILYGLEPENAALKISQKGATVAVKLGARGSVVARNSELIYVPAVPTYVVDTTAAGDMYAAGFLYAFLKGRSLEESGKCGSILASDVISRVGATLSQSALNQVK